MTITAVASGGIAGHATSASSWTPALVASLAADHWILIQVATDNISTTDGATNDHTGCSGESLSWTKLGEYTNGEGAAGSGCTISAWLARNTTGSTISTVDPTFTFSAAVAEKAATSHKFSTTGSNLGLVSGSLSGNATDASAGFGSASISGLTSAEYLYVRSLAKEANGTTQITVSSGFTALAVARSRNNADAVFTRGEFLINTSTGETSNPTLSTSGDTAGIFFALSESASTPVAFGGTIADQAATQNSSFSLDATSYFSGTETPFSYSLSGTLPAGLSHSSGTISGTPTVFGSFGPLTIRATDTGSNTADSNAFAILIEGNPTADIGYYAVAQSGNAAMEHTTASHSFHHDGKWWTFLRVSSDWNLYEESGNVPGSAGSTVDWVSTAHLSSVHSMGQCSVALDAANNKAYVIGFGASSNTAFRVLTYSAGAWSVTTSFNLTGTAGVGLGTGRVEFANNEKLSLGIDTNGVPYVVAGNMGTSGGATAGLWFAWPDSAGSLGGTWSAVNIDSNAGTPEGDASARWGGIVSQGGTSYHVISYSDHTNELIRMAWHQVETTLSNYSSGWSTETIDSTISVDNHVWAGVMTYGSDQVVVTLAKAGDAAAAGRLYAFTSQLGASMTWTHKRHRVTNGVGMAGLTERSSRPVGILDQINGDVYVVYHAYDSHPYGWIGYKKASLAALLAAASDTAVFDVSVARNSHVLINDESLDAAWNAKTPPHPITSGMGYVPITSAVAASSSAGDAIWWAAIEVEAPSDFNPAWAANANTMIQGAVA